MNADLLARLCAAAERAHDVAHVRLAAGRPNLPAEEALKIAADARRRAEERLSWPR